MNFFWYKLKKIHYIWIKNAYKEPRHYEDEALLTDPALHAMSTHFHNGITFPIKLSELQHVLFEVFALVVA